jgi:hypothetical protein
MNVIYRQFDPSDNTIIIEHSNINPKSEIENKILSNPKTPLCDFVEDINGPKKILMVNTFDLSVYTLNLDRIEHNSLSRCEIHAFLTTIDNIDQPQNQDSYCTLFIKSKNIDDQLKSHLIHEFMFFHSGGMCYYKISKNVSWMSFLNTDTKYTVRYIYITK